MQLIAKADVVLALGTRLNPFSTLPSYGIDLLAKNAKIIQVDITRPHRSDQESRCSPSRAMRARGRADFRDTCRERSNNGPGRSPRHKSSKRS